MRNSLFLINSMSPFVYFDLSLNLPLFWSLLCEISHNYNSKLYRISGRPCHRRILECDIRVINTMGLPILVILTRASIAKVRQNLLLFESPSFL